MCVHIWNPFKCSRYRFKNVKPCKTEAWNPASSSPSGGSARLSAVSPENRAAQFTAGEWIKYSCSYLKAQMKAASQSANQWYKHINNKNRRTWKKKEDLKWCNRAKWHTMHFQDLNPRQREPVSGSLNVKRSKDTDRHLAVLSGHLGLHNGGEAHKLSTGLRGRRGQKSEVS